MLVPDVLDFGRIYEGPGEGKFNFSLPRTILEEQLDGRAFGRGVRYEGKDQERVYVDIKTLAAQAFAKVQPVAEGERPRAVVSAGSPGAGKTQLMRALLSQEPVAAGYIDPDDVCLLGMKQTFLRQLDEGIAAIETQQLGSDERAQAIAQLRLAAYTLWRPASNAACNLILANLIRERCPFYYGTTSSAALTGVFFKFLKAQGYELDLVHVTAPDDVRWTSVKKREDTFVQSTEEDTRTKGEMVPQRLQDTYLVYADKISFYYRDRADGEATLAAVWTRKASQESGAAVIGELEVLDEAAYEGLKSTHDAICRRLGKENILWDTCMASSDRV